MLAPSTIDRFTLITLAKLASFLRKNTMEFKRDSSNKKLTQEMYKKNIYKKEYNFSFPHFPPSLPLDFWTRKERKQAGGVGCGNAGGRVVGVRVARGGYRLAKGGREGRGWNERLVSTLAHFVGDGNSVESG